MKEDKNNVFQFPAVEYTYTHHAQGNGECFCGKKIKNLFFVQHPTGHVVVLGSECINKYEEFACVKQAIKDEKKSKSAEAKAAKEEAARLEFLELLTKLKELGRTMGYIQDPTLYRLVRRYKFTGKYVNKLKQMKESFKQINEKLGMNIDSAA
jgi:macrodomain Ter protein organizer (MatP/YcbG family)